MPRLPRILAIVLSLSLPAIAGAEDGYRLWLRYDPLPEAATSAYADLQTVTLATATGEDSPTIEAARAELATGLAGLLGRDLTITLTRAASPPTATADSYALRAAADGVTITAHSDTGALYGAFALLRHLQQTKPLAGLDVATAPRVDRRIINHWDDLNGFVERGYAGFSIWQWYDLPDIRSPRYRDYARACASIGINGASLTNVNANALILSADYLTKVAALADEFRPYGIRVYLTARFSAPIELGGLPTADPLDPAVAAWWRAKADEIYRAIPDFGGFLVKANSEGQPGPQDYGRNHAEGANMLADAVGPHGGIVLWRAFVYSPDNTTDRVKQAFNEFQPLDGKFRDNVVIQIKNGPLDFMPREPFSPLFGAMPQTPLAVEFQITQEYFGGATELAFLAPLWKEVLTADTYRPQAGSTIAQVVDGSLDGHGLSVIAGVSNIGGARNWTGHPLAQANWYAWGRLAWDPGLSSAAIAEEWIRQTFSNDTQIVDTLGEILLGSRETVVNYSMPLGLHHIMAEGHHFGPGPWVDEAGRADWTSVYYHRADQLGLGADRTATGSNALEQYAPELAARWGDLATCPENLLLWFHHVPWDHRMKSGRLLWDELCLKYQQGVDEVRTMQREWASLAGQITEPRFTEVQQRLARQEQDARNWRDACLLYFQQFSRRPLPVGVEPPAHDLDYYKSVKLRYAPGHPGDY